MPLDATQQQRIRDHLTALHGGIYGCDVCLQRDWALWQIELGRFLFLDARTATPPGDLVVALVCRQCGQMVLLDLAYLPPGIVSDQNAAQQQPPA